MILHSFGHLSESKATPEFSQNLLNEFEEKLILQGFEVSQTPFGYFLDLNIEAPGFSLARIFKSF
ncbi:MAG: threonyl-tRNA synthetase editing domain-containing protein [Saprospiraceae bacterium]